MKERPILFSGPMVRAILAGTKTQTRRIVKGAESKKWQAGPCHILDSGPTNWNIGGTAFSCPYGQPGDRLWVKETWRTDAILDTFAPRELAECQPIKFEANDAFTAICGFEWGKIRQSIFMRRWMSRITLEIVSVRVERLQDISEADAIAEGLKRCASGWVFPDSGYDRSGLAHTMPQLAYAEGWDQITGAGSWDANPWVWVIEFRRVEA